MADSTIDGLDTLASVDRTTDKLAIWDASDSNTKEATINSALGISGGNPVSTSDSQTLTNKTFTSPIINTPTLTVLDNALTIQDNSDTTKQAQFQLSGITTGNTRTYTLPDFNATFATLAGTETLTNKTISAPTITNPTLTVDTISEFTSANGVNIDGLLIKDGLLPAGNIQPLNLTSGTGSSWVWQSWSPTFVALSGGTLNYAKYIQTGKTVHFRLKYTLGGAGVSGTVTFTTPTSITSDMVSNIEVIEGSVTLQDTGTAAYGGIMRWASSSSIEIAALGSAGSYINVTTLSSTIPHIWASTDVITVAGTYQAA